MKISINAPSYKRPKVKTLDYITSCKVWVAESEAEEYLSQNPKENIIVVPDAVQGNLCRIRNYILDKELKDNDVVLLIDDDLGGVYHWEPSGYYGFNRKKLSEEELYIMLEHYSELCREFGFLYWGINCNADPRSYRQYTPFNTTRYIGGPFQCFLKGNELRYDERLPLKEDYDMTMQNLNKYRGCLRVNKYFYVAEQSKQKGGCASYRNRKREEEQFDMLVKKWGSKYIRRDKADVKQLKKTKIYDDYNPILKPPIPGA